MRLVLFHKNTLTIEELNIATFREHIRHVSESLVAVEDENGLRPYELGYRDCRVFSRRLCSTIRSFVVSPPLKEAMRLCIRRRSAVGVTCAARDVNLNADDRMLAVAFERAHEAWRHCSWMQLAAAFACVHVPLATKYAAWLSKELSRRCYAA